jgi:LPS export ABC transporter protein LptC
LDGSIQFTDVRFDYSPDTNVPWTVNANSATILPVRQRVQLRGDVRAISSEEGSDRDTEIRTEYLELDPQRYVAETEERVQIRIGARSLTATGMLASFNDSRLELKSNVSGKFMP